MCNCISYNQPKHSGGTRAEVMLPCPAHLRDSVSEAKRDKGICVDTCIADAIQMLWAHRVETRGCCCGHNRGPASVIIGETEDAERVKALLRDNDSKQWEVMQWRLVVA